jgi:hypothetical protein
MNSQAPRRSDDEIIRSMIEKENDYINQRVTWFATLQGLLIAALSFASRQPEGDRFYAILCLLGFLVAFIILFPISAAHMTMSHLLDWWDRNKPDNYSGPDVIGMRPPSPQWISRYVGPWTWLIIVFLVAWFLMGYRSVLNLFH